MLLPSSNFYFCFNFASFPVSSLAVHLPHSNLILAVVTHMYSVNVFLYLYYFTVYCFLFKFHLRFKTFFPFTFILVSSLAYLPLSYLIFPAVTHMYSVNVSLSRSFFFYFHLFYLSLLLNLYLLFIGSFSSYLSIWSFFFLVFPLFSIHPFAFKHFLCNLRCFFSVWA